MILSFIFVISYLLVRFGYAQEIDQLHPYASYAFEASVIGLALVFYHQKLKVAPPKGFAFWIELPLNLVLGSLTYIIAKSSQYFIPFNWSLSETIPLLIFFGPVLEEFLFRFALWQPIAQLSHHKGTTTLLTALLFSWSHFYPYFFVPAVFRPFILFQTIYTFFLGIWWGTRLAQTKNLTIPLALHISFNLGFFLAAAPEWLS